MRGISLWKYCTAGMAGEFLLSFGLLDGMGWTEEKRIACLYALSKYPERHYRKILTPKNGGGFRELLAPDPLLRGVQRVILRGILERQKCPAYAAAYRKGAGIRENASPHTGKKQILKLDIADFFTSVTFPMIRRVAFPFASFPPQAALLLTSLCCYGEYLPQGAPTSPMISNLVMRPFDFHMGKWCAERNITYTRYSDDMTFSGDFDAAAVRRKAWGFLDAMGFSLNESKTKIIAGSSRQTVTGLVVNESPKAPREYRRGLRQELYYCLRFGVKSHLDATGNKTEPQKYLRSLLGKINFVLYANPGDREFREAKREALRLLSELPKPPS